MQSIIRLFIGSLLLLFTALGVEAHEPFDCSSRLTVKEDEIRVEVMMGMDGVREIIPAAGFSPVQIKNIVLMRPARNAVDLPVEFSARLFEVNAGVEKLAARAVKASSDGLEVDFAIVFPRPASGKLDVQATYYEAAPVLRNGSLVAYDNQGVQLAGVLLSRTHPRVQIIVPGLEPKTDSPVVTSRPAMTSEAAASMTVTLPVRSSFSEFFALGVEHILTGFDHLLFLAALLIGVRKPAAMLGVITAFTVAHSVTLALAALNIVSLTPRVVEPLIAASIIVVCVENIYRKGATADRYWLAGGFGLIHGFGFASALQQTGMGGSGTAIVMPLLGFNVGVEAGQLAVALVTLPALILMRRWPGFVRYGTPATSALVILVSAYWLVERTLFLK